MNDLTLDVLRTRVQFPPPPPFIIMFSWFKKKNIASPENLFHEQDTIDAIEESLWEIKEQYDLPTEEVINVVQSKRKSFDYMRKAISAKTNKENI